MSELDPHWEYNWGWKRVSTSPRFGIGFALHWEPRFVMVVHLGTFYVMYGWLMTLRTMSLVRTNDQGKHYFDAESYTHVLTKTQPQSSQRDAE